jgi:hypothetical protein
MSATSRIEATVCAVMKQADSAEEQKRITSLVKSQQCVEDLKYASELSRRKLKEKMRQQFERFRQNMSRLEASVYDRINAQHFAQLDAPLNDIEQNIQQLIANLSSVSIRSNAERNALFAQIERKTKELDDKLRSLENYKYNELDQYVASRPDVNDFLNANVNKLEQFLLEPKAINRLSGDVNWNDWDYQPWQTAQIDSDEDAALERAFEIVDLSDDEIELVEANGSTRKMSSDGSSIRRVSVDAWNSAWRDAYVKSLYGTTDTGITRVFALLTAKPLEYWLS